MALDRNNFIKKVASLVHRRVDGDAVLFIEQYLSPALKSVTKGIALSKPVGHEKLLIAQNCPSPNIVDDTAVSGYYYGDLSSLTTPIVAEKKFLRLVVQNVGGDSEIAQPVHSLASLKLAETHHVVYYFQEGGRVYFNLYTGFVGLDNFIVLGYPYYDDVTAFPDELEDVLIQEVSKYLMMQRMEDLDEIRYINPRQKRSPAS
jgi:hypothetical protein